MCSCFSFTPDWISCGDVTAEVRVEVVTVEFEVGEQEVTSRVTEVCDTPAQCQEATCDFRVLVRGKYNYT